MDISSSALLPEDPKETRTFLNTLPLSNQLDLLLQARGPERLRLLLLSDRPEELVRRLPELEVFLTVQQVGHADVVELVSLTSPEQFQYLLDLDLWKKDLLDPDRVLHWMKVLNECGTEKITQFLQAAEPGFIVLLFKKFIRVMVFEAEPMEVVKRFSLFSLDQHYFIHFAGEEARKSFRPLIEHLYHGHGDLYRRLMDATILELDSEIEEMEYRLRKGRLADAGFPDYEEALEIYRFIPPEKIAAEGGVQGPPDRSGTEENTPSFYFTFQHEGPFLSLVLSRIEAPEEKSRLKQELTALCNKAIVAEFLDRFTLQEMERVTRRVVHTLNLGLQILSQEEESKALEMVRSLPLQRIFQAAIGATLLLRKKASAILGGPWFGGHRDHLAFLDSPHLEKFGGVLRTRPAYYANGTLRDFEAIGDLGDTEAFLRSVEAITHLMAEQLGVTPQRLKDMDLTLCAPREWKEITFSTIFLTGLANQVLRGMFRFEPIDGSLVNDFLSRVLETDGQGKRVIRMEIRKGFREWLDAIEGDEEKRRHLQAFCDFCLDLFGEEFGRIPPGEEIDPRYVRGLLIRG